MLGEKKGGREVGNNFFALSYRFRTLWGISGEFG